MQIESRDAVSVAGIVDLLIHLHSIAFWYTSGGTIVHPPQGGSE